MFKIRYGIETIIYPLKTCRNQAKKGKTTRRRLVDLAFRTHRARIILWGCYRLTLTTSFILFSRPYFSFLHPMCCFATKQKNSLKPSDPNSSSSNTDSPSPDCSVSNNTNHQLRRSSLSNRIEARLENSFRKKSPAPAIPDGSGNIIKTLEVSWNHHPLTYWPALRNYLPWVAFILTILEISEQISGSQQAEGGNGQNSSTDNSLTPSRDKQLQLSRRISLGQKLETASQRLDLPSFKFKQSSKESSKNEEVSGQWLYDSQPTFSFLGSVFLKVLYFLFLFSILNQNYPRRRNLRVFRPVEWPHQISHP